MNKLESIKQTLFEDESIFDFCHKYSITDEEYARNFYKLVTQKANNTICNSCKGKNCKMDPYGMQTRLKYSNQIGIEYFECPKIEHYNQDKIKFLYYPEKLDFANKKLDRSENRAEAINAMLKFNNNYKKGSFIKGIYFHGPFGTGKSFLMHKLAYGLIKKDVNVIMAYYPDMVRFIKSSIGTGDIEKTINELKYIDVLMLDDIGAENNTAFIRDEILGPILQFRLESNLPICFTSNLSLSLLREHFSESKDEINKIKSERIIERIRYLTTEVEVMGKNYRFEG